ncbi:MAG: M17 family peptidase N-terminal domain-containing protein [Polyangiaceae bacterium]
MSKLDEIEAEILVASVFSDVRPARGVAGLCDFRLGGRLSRLMKQSFITGASGEVVLVPGKPLLTFDKVLVFGAGDSSAFGERSYVELIDKILDTLTGLAARTAVVELPGRQAGTIEAARAVDLLLTAAGGSPQHDVWTLVEEVEGRTSIEQHMVEAKRRVRRSL